MAALIKNCNCSNTGQEGARTLVQETSGKMKAEGTAGPGEAGTPPLLGRQMGKKFQGGG